jgi:hypothetical protein
MAGFEVTLYGRIWVTPEAPGNHGYIDDAEEFMQQARHWPVNGRLTLRKSSIQIECDKSFHSIQPSDCNIGAFK